LSTFAGCWLIVPVAFFSASQSKLPGYILPAVPAGAFLLVEYLRRHLSKVRIQLLRGGWWFRTPW